MGCGASKDMVEALARAERQVAEERQRAADATKTAEQKAAAAKEEVIYSLLFQLQSFKYILHSLVPILIPIRMFLDNHGKGDFNIKPVTV